MKYEDTLHLTGVTAIQGFDNLAAKHEYNLRSLKDSITKQTRELSRLEHQIKRLNQPSILDPVFPGRRQNRLEAVLSDYNLLVDRWQHSYGATFPELTRDDGKQVHMKNLLDEMPKELGDGYFHVNKNVHSATDKNSIAILEEHAKIPFAIGKELKAIWDQPGDVYVHATPMKENSYRNLGSVMHDGLACNGNNILYTAFKVESFPDFVRYVCSSSNYHQNSCHGAIILKAQESPEVIENHIDPKYVAAYVSCQDAQLRGLARQEELLNLNAPEYRIKEVFSQHYAPEKYWCTVQHDKDWAHVFIDDKFGGVHTEEYISMEAVLSEHYHEDIEQEINDNKTHSLFLEESFGQELEHIKELDADIENHERSDYTLNEEEPEL